MTRRRGGGPRPHHITTPDDRAYPWAQREPLSDQPWKCVCGSPGGGQAAAGKHLTDRAKAALARLDNDHAWAAAVTSTGRRDDVLACRLVWNCRHWVRHGLRKHLTGYYDHWGNLSVEVDWEAIAAAIAAGQLQNDGDTDDGDLLVLRVAVSLAGVAIELKLSDLWRLSDDDSRHVRDALLKLISVEDDSPT